MQSVAKPMAELPRHPAMGRMVRAFEAASIVAAIALVGMHALRLWMARFELSLFWPLCLPAAMLAADLVSGVVHWAADTWGHESMAVVGPRFLQPFRVHHVNPSDFLKRDFIDCNGDVCML